MPPPVGDYTYTPEDEKLLVIVPPQPQVQMGTTITTICALMFRSARCLRTFKRWDQQPLNITWPDHHSADIMLPQHETDTSDQRATKRRKVHFGSTQVKEYEVDNKYQRAKVQHLFDTTQRNKKHTKTSSKDVLKGSSKKKKLRRKVSRIGVQS